MSPPPTLGALIRQRRLAMGLTQEQLASRIGGVVRQSDISRLESDRIGLPRRERLQCIASALEVSVNDLLMCSVVGATLPEQSLATQRPNSLRHVTSRSGSMESQHQLDRAGTNQQRLSELQEQSRSLRQRIVAVEQNLSMLIEEFNALQHEITVIAQQGTHAD